MIKRPIQEIQCFILFFRVFAGAKHQYLQMWKSWMKNTLVLIYYDTTQYYSTNSWKFQTARISLNIYRPLNPIKLKSSPCLWYIWSYGPVTLLMGVTFIGSGTPKLLYLLPIFYTLSKDTWLGLSTDIVSMLTKDSIISYNDEIWSLLDFFQEKIKKSWSNWTKLWFTQFHRAQFFEYKNPT